MYDWCGICGRDGCKKHADATKCADCNATCRLLACSKAYSHKMSKKKFL